MKKHVVVGVTSSIAIYKSVQLVSDLIKKGYDVSVVMSKNACEFISPMTFSSLTNTKTHVDTFDRHVDYSVEHISISDIADVFIMAPATANVIAKIAHGIADDMLTTTFLASICPKIIAPAMNTKMLDSKVTMDNIETCRKYGMHVVDTDEGRLACGDVGKGKMVEVATLIEAVDMALESKKILKGKKVMITAGPTIEKIDPVRYITNHSSGKMGYALARVARNMGAEVTLISGTTHLEKPYGINTIDIESTCDLMKVVEKEFQQQDYILCAAAPADYGINNVSEHKIKKEKDGLEIEWKRNPDILKFIGDNKTTQKVCGFATETQDIIQNAYNKMKRKNCDMIVVNDITQTNAGFKTDTNIASILYREERCDYDMMSKGDLAKVILETLYEL